jgi:hypothetical protein
VSWGATVKSDINLDLGRGIRVRGPLYLSSIKPKPSRNGILVTFMIQIFEAIIVSGKASGNILWAKL